MVTEPFELEGHVETAWLATLAPAAVDPAATWEEAGADSLKGLRLLLHLERMLGRRLTFDIIDPDMTISSLTRALAAGARSNERTNDLRLTPTMCLVPGIFGDEPILASFRRWFGTALHFAVIELPDIDEPGTTHVNMVRTGQAVAREIERRYPRGELMIAGYSFGGSVAYEAARALLANGRQVSLLCMLDVTLNANGTPPRLISRPSLRTVRLTCVRLLAQWDVARRLILAATKRFRPKALIATQRLLLLAFRRHASRRWQPTCLPVPLLAAIAQDSHRNHLANWSRLHPGMVLVQTPGGHAELFQPAAMARLGPAVLTAAGGAALHSRSDQVRISEG